MNDLNQLLPDPRFEPLRDLLDKRLEQAAAEIGPAQLEPWLDPLMRQVLNDGLDRTGADEGTLWLVNAEGTHLVPAFNNGPHAARVVNHFKQPLSAGLICMVFATQQPFVENAVAQNARQSKLLDQLLQVETSALMAVPFVFLGGCRGVLSCVHLKSAATASRAGQDFSPEDLLVLDRTSALLARLLEFKLLAQVLGWKG